MSLELKVGYTDAHTNSYNCAVILLNSSRTRRLFEAPVDAVRLDDLALIVTALSVLNIFFDNETTPGFIQKGSLSITARTFSRISIACDSLFAMIDTFPPLGAENNIYQTTNKLTDVVLLHCLAHNKIADYVTGLNISLSSSYSSSARTLSNSF